MPRTSVTTQVASPLGIAVALATPDVAGSIVDVGNNITLVVRNADASSKTVTVQTPAQLNGVDVAEVALVIAAGSTGFVALDPALFKRGTAPDAGRAYVDYSAITSVTVAVIQR